MMTFVSVSIDSEIQRASRFLKCNVAYEGPKQSHPMHYPPVITKPYQTIFPAVRVLLIGTLTVFEI